MGDSGVAGRFPGTAVENLVRRLAVLSLCLAVLSGCAKKEPQPRPQAGSADRVSLRIGLIPEQNIFKQLERYQPLAAYLSEKSGARIELTILTRYGNIVDNFRSAELDGAFFGSFTYALAHRRLGVEVLARPVALDNTSTYYGLIFARKDSGIRGLPDMKGKRFVFVDKATTAGYLLPMDYFRKGGVRDLKGYFLETYFAGTHEAAIRDVLEGRAHAGAAKSTVFDRLAAEEPRIRDELVILATSLHVPENGLAVREDLDPSLKRRLKEVLLAMHEDPEGEKALAKLGATRFHETHDEDYDPVFRYAREVGLDLSTYDYRND